MAALKFIPPKLVARYALFVDHGEGRGFFKSYDLLASAKLAYHAHGHRYDSKILENVDGQWYVLHAIPAGATYEDLPWVKKSRSNWRHRELDRAKPMTREEYAEWRLAVERERIRDRFDIEIPASF